MSDVPYIKDLQEELNRPDEPSFQFSNLNTQQKYDFIKKLYLDKNNSSITDIIKLAREKYNVFIARSTFFEYQKREKPRDLDQISDQYKNSKKKARNSDNPQSKLSTAHTILQISQSNEIKESKDLSMNDYNSFPIAEANTSVIEYKDNEKVYLNIKIINDIEISLFGEISKDPLLQRLNIIEFNLEIKENTLPIYQRMKNIYDAYKEFFST